MNPSSLIIRLSYRTLYHANHDAVQKHRLYISSAHDKGDKLMKLTARQEQVLDVIRRYVADTGYPPTRADIAR